MRMPVCTCPSTTGRVKPIVGPPQNSHLHTSPENSGHPISALVHIRTLWCSPPAFESFEFGDVHTGGRRCAVFVTLSSLFTPASQSKFNLLTPSLCKELLRASCFYKSKVPKNESKTFWDVLLHWIKSLDHWVLSPTRKVGGLLYLPRGVWPASHVWFTRWPLIESYAPDPPKHLTSTDSRIAHGSWWSKCARKIICQIRTFI